MSPFIGHIQWPEVEPSPAGPGRVTTSSIVSPDPGHSPVVSSDHQSLAVTDTLAPGASDDNSDNDGSGEEIRSEARPEADSTSHWPSEPLYSTALPPDLGGGQVMRSVTGPFTTPSSAQEEMQHSPEISTVTGSADNRSSDQLDPRMLASTQSVPGIPN